MTHAEVHAQVRRVTDVLESAYQSTRRSARNLSLLYASGGATCQDVATYNTLAVGVYNTQRAILDELRARGAENVPGAPPTPTLFYWSDASRGPVMSCEAQLQDGGGTRTPLPAGSLRVLFEAPPPAVAGSTGPQGQLGVVVIPLWIIIVGGIALTIAVAVGVGLIEYFQQRGITERTLGEIDRRTKHLENLWGARAACVNDCVSSGGDSAACYSRCERLLPEGDIRPTPWTSAWSFWSLVGLASAGMIVGAVVYRRHQRAA